MKIKLWEALTLNEATSFMTQNIDLSDMDKQHIIIVPDRFSLLMEKLVLDTLGNQAIFNVEVVGLTRLITRLLEEIEQPLPSILTMSDGLILTSKALKNVSDKFLTFHKTNINFCYEIYRTLSQFKSSGVKPQELLRLHPNMQGYKKYHDLGLIYEEYESLRAQQVDANGLLEYFIEKVQNANVLKNKKLYFAQFDSFTHETYEAIKALATFTEEINISLATAGVQSNYYIYEDDIKQKLKLLAKEMNFTIDVKTQENSLSKEQNKIVKNLFAFNLEEGEKDDFLSVIASSSSDSECALVAKLIKYKIVGGGRYKDFAVACSDLTEASQKLTKYLDLLDIPYYCDLSVTADQTLLANYIFKILEVFTKGFSLESLVELSAHPLFMLPDSETFISRLQDLNVFGKARFCKLFPNMPEQFKSILALDNSQNYATLCQSLNEILQQSKSSYETILESVKEDGYLYSINSQMWTVMQETLLTLEREYSNEECSKNEFLKQLKLILSFKEVSAPPAYIDAVMIGDATSSYFGRVKNLIILGGESLPSLTSDKGLISDDDIERLSAVRKIEPSIRMINRRNRFKLFNLLTSATDSLTISFSEFNDEGKKVEPPSYIDGLLKIFGQKITSSISFYHYGGKLDEFKLQLNLGSKRFYECEGAILGRYGEAVSSLIKSETLNCGKLQIKADAFKLFFPDEYTKVTQLETYFSCPFKHFAIYGLKLKERQNHEFDERDLGNICHEIARRFVYEYKDTLPQLSMQTAEQYIKENLLDILESLALCEKLEAAIDKSGTLDYITRLVTLLLSRIIIEAQHSSFKPLFIEKNIEGLKLSAKGRQLKFVGKIDRVDVSGDYYRIIDYKTGIVNPILKDLYYGDKLQLFLYDSAIKTMLNKTSAGVLYFDSRYDYDKNDKKQPIFKGLVINDEQAVKLFDPSLSGNILDVTIKDGECSGGSVAKFPLDNFENYALYVTQQALNDIASGYIMPSPSPNACDRCNFSSICGHKEEEGCRKKVGIKQEFIMEALYGKRTDT